MKVSFDQVMIFFGGGIVFLVGECCFVGMIDVICSDPRELLHSLFFHEMEVTGHHKAVERWPSIYPSEPLDGS